MRFLHDSSHDYYCCCRTHVSKTLTPGSATSTAQPGLTEQDIDAWRIPKRVHAFLEERVQSRPVKRCRAVKTERKQKEGAPALGERFAGLRDLTSCLAPTLCRRFQSECPWLKLDGPAGRGLHVRLHRMRGAGESCPRHFDNPGPPSRRRLSALLYLNENWDRERDGGLLVLEPLFAPSLEVHLPNLCFGAWVMG